MAEQDLTQTRITAEAYYQLPEYAEHELMQLIDGEVVIDMPPILRHQEIVIKIIKLLLAVIEARGGHVYTAPTEVYLDAENIYEPDVLYLAPDSVCQMEVKRLVGPPELVVEVLAPSSVQRDRETKFKAYEKHGVREYWLADPLHQALEVFVLGTSGQFARQGLYVPGDVFDSPILGQPVNASDLLA